MRCDTNVVTLSCCIGCRLRRSTASYRIFQELLLNGEATHNLKLEPDQITVVTDPINKRKRMILHLQLQYLFLGLTCKMSSSVTFFVKESHKEILTLKSFTKLQIFIICFKTKCFKNVSNIL